MYGLSKEEHEELLTNSVTSNYKTVSNSIKKMIIMAGKQILKNNEILLDVILDKINLAIREYFSFNQWKNTQNIIDWFNKIPDKKVHKFVVFDIKEFYPSIKEQLLKEALDFANSYINIPENDKKIINHARKSLLFNKQQTWIKKESGLFDVTMGAYDGAEVCELVGSFLLYALSLKYNKTNIGLYRDDGLAVFRNVSGAHFEKNKKEFQKLFQHHGLKWIIKCNLKIVD